MDANRIVDWRGAPVKCPIAIADARARITDDAAKEKRRMNTEKLEWRQVDAYTVVLHGIEATAYITTSGDEAGDKLGMQNWHFVHGNTKHSGTEASPGAAKYMLVQRLVDYGLIPPGIDIPESLY